MLIKLFVQNYALIKELDINLEKGLTIITGETGAGKSILLGALSLILGTRADSSVLLDKKDKCIVEGTFQITDYDLNEFFNINEIDYDHIAILRREINPAGKSRAFINDTPVTLNLLKELAESLIDIHSQHQTLMLNDNTFQLSVIDSFAGNSELKQKYHVSYNSYRKLKKELDEKKEKAGRNSSDLEYYQFQLKQLEDAKLIVGEQEELEKEQEILLHAEEIKLALTNASALLSSDESSILARLKEVKHNLTRIHEYLPGGEVLLSRTGSSFIELDDLAGEIDKISSAIEADPTRLNFVNERLDYIYTLNQKHRVADVNELITKKEELADLINSIVTGSEKVSEMELKLENEKKILNGIAGNLSVNRKNMLEEIEAKITDLLKLLGMPNARFRILLSILKDYSHSGLDQADFLFSANKQIMPENLAKIASGGELSRVMLSLKSFLTKNNNLPTIIFDEIDSGVSGEVADKVGQILAGMGRYMQVINITHLPQVASRGTRHYHVYKDDSGDTTVTRVKLLSMDERVIEVARLLSGSEVTGTAIANARELLQAASNN